MLPLALLLDAAAATLLLWAYPTCTSRAWRPCLLTSLSIATPRPACAQQVTALLRHDKDVVKKKALLCMQRFLQVDPGVGPDVERHLVDKLGYKVRGRAGWGGVMCAGAAVLQAGGVLQCTRAGCRACRSVLRLA